jgi:alkaline phosphatase
VRAIVSAYYGIEDLSAEEVASIQEAAPGYMNSALGAALSSRSCLGWTTAGHTGEDVFLYAYGVVKPMGMVENTQIAHYCAQALGFELGKMDDKLFQEASAAFGAAGATIRTDESDPLNRVLVVEKGSTVATLPASKDLMTAAKGGKQKTWELEGITVYAPKSKKWYVSKEAVSRFTEAAAW